MAKSKNSTSWTLALLEETFGLQEASIVEEMPLLSEWLAAKDTLTESEKANLDSLRIDLADIGKDWDEEDLKMNFIAFLLDIAHYVRLKGLYRSYFDKAISAQIGDYHLSSKPDMMLAKGARNELRTPYFCFHEYKKSQPDKDPRGQLIQDMLIAQAVNGSNKPIYGAYVTGKDWYFVILEGKKYKISNSFDATITEDLHQIVYILRQFWTILTTTLI